MSPAAPDRPSHRRHRRHAPRVVAGAVALLMLGSSVAVAAPPDDAGHPGPLTGNQRADERSRQHHENGGKRPEEPPRGPRFSPDQRGSKDLADKLGAGDVRRLDEATASGEDDVTIMVATDRGAANDVRDAITQAGGTVGRVEADLGWVRATVPADRIDVVAARSDVVAIDLDRTFDVPDPTPDAGPKDDATISGAPGPDTPADNPWLPIRDTGAAAFLDRHSSWDGTGVTIGIVDTGIDLDHPALQTTTDGSPKVVDSRTATDPLLDSDPSWLRMDRNVTGPSFSSSGHTWTAPEGEFLYKHFLESTTRSLELTGDLNHDGDTADLIGVLLDPETGRVWVDSDLDRDFTNEPPMTAMVDGGTAGHFGVDNPDTAISEQTPFVVEHRPDVDLTPLGGPWVGRVADYVNIGLVSATHGTHVAGITAGNGLFGGDMTGAAPGAQLVSMRACTFRGGCTAVALTEGMIDLVTTTDVDVVNLSIGGLDPLNDDSDAIAQLHDRIIADHDIQIIGSAGNSGPGVNTVGAPSTGDRVLSIAASVTADTFAANYGADVGVDEDIMWFSSRGPGEDGALKPTLAAPGSAISTIPGWLDGVAASGVDYDLPPGYAMFNGTSMAAPQATGAYALLLSAARAGDLSVTSDQMRTALTDTARQLDAPTAAQGMGVIDVNAAWDLLQDGIDTGQYRVAAPTCTKLADLLATPGEGPGIHNRCALDAGGQAVDTTRTYDVTLDQLDGKPGRHFLRWRGNDGTFSAPRGIVMRPGRDTVVEVTATPTGTGLHSAILEVDHPDTVGIDAIVPVTVVVPEPFDPTQTATLDGDLSRGQSQGWFLDVPEGVRNLQLNLDGVGDGDVRVTAIDPTGMPVPATRHFSHPDPIAGVWEFHVHAHHSSTQPTNPFRLSTALQGLSLAPAEIEVGTLQVHDTAEAQFTATNEFSDLTVVPDEGQLGRWRDLTGTVPVGDTAQAGIHVPLDGTRLEIEVTPRAEADMDVLLVHLGTQQVVAMARRPGPSGERIVVDDLMPGTHLVVVSAVSGSGEDVRFDYRERMYWPSLGSVTASTAGQDLATGESLHLDTAVTPHAEPFGAFPGLVGRVPLRNEQGAEVGAAEVLVNQVTTPDYDVMATTGPFVAFDVNDAGTVVGDDQINWRTRPVKWTAEGGQVELPVTDNTFAGSAHDVNEVGDAVGQLLVSGGGIARMWKATGEVVDPGAPDWRDYDRTAAFALNDHGTVVGESQLRERIDGVWHDHNDAWLWTSEDGFVQLEHLSDNTSQTRAVAIANDGTSVGLSMVNAFAPHATMWDSDGTVTDLGTLEGMQSSQANDIAENGTVVGVSGHDAFVWTASDGMQRLMDYGFGALALEVTEGGWIIGSAQVTPDAVQPVVWDPQGRIHDMTDMNPTSSEFLPVSAYTINNNLEVMLYGFTQSGSGMSWVTLPWAEQG